MALANYTFLSKADYIHALTQAAIAAVPGSQIAITTLLLDTDDPAITALLTAMGDAARRGCVVTLLVDGYNFISARTGRAQTLLYRYLLGQRLNFAREQHALEAFVAAGGKYYPINMPHSSFTLPIAGRSHIKVALVGDKVFIGGCNLYVDDEIDLMVSWCDKTTASSLWNLLAAIAGSGNVRNALGDVDSTITLDTMTSILIDAGVPRQSAIYDTALELIDNAKEWIFMTCQYFPGGKTARHLAAAQKRGVKVEINYSHPRAHGSGASLQYVQQLAQHVKHIPRSFFDGQLDRTAPNLHAKILASEQSAMVGSHNYVPQGVELGTAELALLVQDPLFAQEICAFMRQQLADSQHAHHEKISV